MSDIEEVSGSRLVGRDDVMVFRDNATVSRDNATVSRDDEMVSLDDINENQEPVAVLSFYSFTNIEDPESLLPKLLFLAKKKYIKGTIIVSHEGMNGSISGKEENLHFLIEEMKKMTGAHEISVKVNYCDQQPFSKVKVKIKPEIVSLKIGHLDVENLKGEYVEPKDWDNFIAREDVILVDTRNDYEVKVGTFKGAVDPKTETFRDFPEWVEKNKDLFENKKIAMCCTGGIRCEKSTAYMKSLGYNEVYHLKGGILQYLEDTHNANGVWNGECFVFDDRGAVRSDLSPSEGFWVRRGQTAKSVSQSK